jgi:hypothetical protein
MTKSPNLEPTRPGIVRRTLDDEGIAAACDQQQFVRNIIRRLAGDQIEVRRFIVLSLANPEQVLLAAIHEAFHDIEMHLLSSRELALAIRETPRLVRGVRDTFGYTPSEGTGMAGTEVRAQAFVAYAAKRGGYSALTGVRALERILRTFRALRNWSEGLGFQTIEDLLGAAYEGKFAGRQSRHRPAPLCRGQTANELMAPTLRGQGVCL